MMKPSFASLLLPVAAAVAVLAAWAVSSVRGAETYLTQQRQVGATEVKIGLSNAQSGRAGALGTEVRRGCEAFFKKVNAAGGIHGRKLTLVAYDDRYEPLPCIVNTERLINEDNVFALCNYVGTPTARAAQPLVAEARIPLVGLFTGAASLREPVDPHVFNVRASYGEETEALVDRLTRDRKATRIAVFVQRDGYGDAVRGGVEKALAKRNLPLAGAGTYTRNTIEVADGLEALIAAKPDAVIMGGTYQPCAALVRAAVARKFSPVFASVSFIGTEGFIEAAGPAAEGVIISQVLPSPEDSRLSLVAEYQAAMRALDPALRFTYASLEGYVNAAVLAAGLRDAGPQPDTGKLIAALETLDTDLGGVRCTFQPTSHQGLKDVHFTRVTAGRPQPVNDLAP